MEFMDFTDTEPLKNLKHASTRWLSLQNCITRTLHHWSALSSYFNSHEMIETDTKISRIASLLSNPEVKMYFFFLEFILVPLNEFNTTFQADVTTIGIIHDHMQRPLRKFLLKFVQSSMIASHDITDVPYDNRVNQHEDDNLAVGRECRTYLHDNSDDIPPSTLNSFFRGVISFYMAVTKKMLSKFPFKDSTLKNLGFLNPNYKGKISGSCAVDIVSRFPQLVEQYQIDQLQEEYDDYRVTPMSELPSTDLGLDNFWSHMSELKDPFTHITRFGVLSKLAKACRVLPTSNADPQRIFSMLKKIQTDMRSE